MLPEINIKPQLNSCFLTFFGTSRTIFKVPFGMELFGREKNIKSTIHLYYYSNRDPSELMISMGTMPEKL